MNALFFTLYRTRMNAEPILSYFKFGCWLKDWNIICKQKFFWYDEENILRNLRVVSHWLVRNSNLLRKVCTYFVLKSVISVASNEGGIVISNQGFSIKKSVRYVFFFLI